MPRPAWVFSTLLGFGVGPLAAQGARSFQPTPLASYVRTALRFGL